MVARHGLAASSAAGWLACPPPSGAEGEVVPGGDWLPASLVGKLRVVPGRWAGTHLQVHDQREELCKDDEGRLTAMKTI